MNLGSGADAKLLNTGVAAALAGGAILKQWLHKVTARSKSCTADLVTEADVASQTAIHNLILDSYPDHNFLGEEGLLRTDGAAPYRWVIDPLDGTTNYFHGFPYFAVSIGLECNGELVAGVIYDPTREELFTAFKGHGAYLNDQRLQVSQAAQLQQALLVASFPPGSTPESQPIKQFLRILPHAQTVQRTGSAALNLAYLATGRLDGFWSYSLKPWDMAAGVVIVREAGGQVSKMNGSALALEIPDILATNGLVHDELRNLLTSPVP
ncbi:MAG TPA: inositol monophosphatase family protein [Schlesneria sp.]|jgi:myo-inositol-1(or 4)-monophosphatase